MIYTVIACSLINMTVGFGMDLGKEDCRSIGNEVPLTSANPLIGLLTAEEAVCVGCGSAIYDPFIMHVQPDLKWHGRCLKCHKCERGLSEEASCFVRNGKTYCREDYCNSSFLQRCAGCQQPITKVDLVLRIRGQTFHMGCFRCVACSAILQPGEEIAYHRNMPYCLRDAKLTLPDKWEAPSSATASAATTGSTRVEGDAEPKVLTLLSPAVHPPTMKSGEEQQAVKLTDGGEGTYFSPQPPHRTRSDSTSSSLDGPMGENDILMTPNSEGSQDEDDCSSLFGCMTSAAVSCLSGDISAHASHAINSDTSSLQQTPTSTGGHHPTRSGNGGGKSSGKRSKEQKTTRVRTVLNEKQLHMLRTCYAANPRPDALMKEQLVEMTGLSPRVIRVWFQNKRCKDKKKQIMIKQMEQHHQNGMHPCGLQGVPMVAGSPLPNDPTMLCPSSGIDVQRISSDNGGPMCSPMKSEVSTPPPPPTSSQPRFSPAYPPPPPPHLFNGMLPPISHVDMKPPSHSSSAQIMLSPSMGLSGGDEGTFPPFQQLVSTFDLMDPMQRGPPLHQDTFINGSRMNYPPGVPPPSTSDGPSFVFPMGDSTFTTLRPINLRPPSLST
uniref:Insulin gene enhancer protein isl-1 n=1 Tax=Mesocestoides corti TaxID=53468 RepID=A0A5K3EL55_MESCO